MFVFSKKEKKKKKKKKNAKRKNIKPNKMPSSSKMYTVVAMLSILKLLFEYSILHKKSGKVCKASRVFHLVLSQLLKMLNKGFISLVIAILLTFETFCNGYYYDEEERDNILEQRIRNLEEPGNTIFTLILTFF